MDCKNILLKNKAVETPPDKLLKTCILWRYRRMKKIEWFGDHYEEVTEITERYGCYLLTITYREKGFTDVKVEDVSKLRLPLLFATSMTIEQANSYLTLFRNCGYIEIA